LHEFGWSLSVIQDKFGNSIRAMKVVELDTLSTLASSEDGEKSKNQSIQFDLPSVTQREEQLLYEGSSSRGLQDFANASLTNQSISGDFSLKTSFLVLVCRIARVT
jgi:hypothetical protein